MRHDISNVPQTLDKIRKCLLTRYNTYEYKRLKEQLTPEEKHILKHLQYTRNLMRSEIRLLMKRLSDDPIA